MSYCRTAVGATFLSLLPTIVFGQAIRGIVVDQTDSPVAGVVMQLLDSASNVAGRALSNERGEFRLATARAGTYRVRTTRIGYRPTMSGAVVLPAGGEVAQRLVLTGIRFLLDTMRVVSQNVCRAFTDSGAATYAVWDQIRTALTSVQLTGNGRNIAATTVAYERTLDSDGRRVRQQSSTVHSDYVKQPWLTISPDSLHRVGFVVTDRDNSTIYYAPGLDALLSNIFIEDHCFRLTSDKRRVGIVFEPTPDRRRIAELRGTLWLDRASSELRSMEFRYANVSPEQEGEAGGSMEFARMTNGAWAISRWNIRMPVIEQRVRSQAFGGSGAHVAEIHVSGGELALARRGNDTLWSRAPMVLAGIVLDSVSGSSIAGARVAIAGTALAAAADSRGRFTIAGVLPGEYTVEVRTPSLDSVSAVHQSPLAFIDSTKTVELRVPNGQQVGAMLCGNRRLDPAGIVLGHVSVRGDSLPPRNVKVAAEWTEVSLHAEAGSVANQKHYLDARGDAHGMFRLCGVPVNTPLVLRASTDKASGAPTPVRIPPNGRFARAELTLDPQPNVGAMFSGVVLTDSTQQPIVDAEVVFPELTTMARTDERGAFRVTDIPPGEQHVVVRHVGYGPLDTQITFTSNENVNKRIFLSRAVKLDSVVVTEKAASDRWLTDFEDHRTIGLGRFLDRAQLAKMEGRSMASVLREFPGIGIVNGRGPHAFVSTTRIRSACQISPPNIPCFKAEGLYYLPDRLDMAYQGLIVACYAQVYVDRILMNRGPPTEPFDLSTISPSQIEAIEYYATPAEMPMKYDNTRGSVCGVVQIWLRRSP
jgi:hypothetical protein